MTRLEFDKFSIRIRSRLVALASVFVQESYAPLKTAIQASVGRFAFSRGTNMLLYFPVIP